MIIMDVHPPAPQSIFFYYALIIEFFFIGGFPKSAWSPSALYRLSVLMFLMTLNHHPLTPQLNYSLSQPHCTMTQYKLLQIFYELQYN